MLGKINRHERRGRVWRGNIKGIWTAASDAAASTMIAAQNGRTRTTIVSRWEFISALEPRVLLSSTQATITSFVGPLNVPFVHRLVTLNAPLKKSLKGARLLNTFSPLDSLKRPSADAISYLNLAAFSPFDIQIDTLQQSLVDAPTQAMFASGEAQPLVVALPNPDGQYQRFKVVQSETMAPELAAKYPGVKTFAGWGIDDPSASLAMDYTYEGFHASVIGAQGEYYIDPYYHLKPKAGEVAYWTRDDRRKLQDAAFDCLTGDEPSENIRSHPLSLQPGTTLLGGELRTYRLAVAATSAYTAFFGGTVTNAMSAIANTVVRLNQLYERDFAIPHDPGRA